MLPGRTGKLARVAGGAASRSPINCTPTRSARSPTIHGALVRRCHVRGSTSWACGPRTSRIASLDRGGGTGSNQGSVSELSPAGTSRSPASIGAGPNRPSESHERLPSTAGIDPTAHREIRPDTPRWVSEGDLVTSRQVYSPPTIAGRGTLSTGDRNDAIRQRQSAKPAQQNFETRCVRDVADETIGQVERRSIKGSGSSNALMQPLCSTEILHRRKRTRLDDSQHGMNRTRSPGCSRLGGLSAGSNRLTCVRPSRCQPPGDSIG
jgi:hypothetical protein